MSELSKEQRAHDLAVNLAIHQGGFFVFSEDENAIRDFVKRYESYYKYVLKYLNVKNNII